MAKRGGAGRWRSVGDTHGHGMGMYRRKVGRRWEYLDPSLLSRADQLKLQHKPISEDEKINLGIRLNIYDAAKSYRVASDQSGVSLRTILQQPEFRNAWRTFQGGTHTIKDAGGRVIEVRPVRGREKTTFREKMDAAVTLGWHRNEREAIDRLRNISP